MEDEVGFFDEGFNKGKVADIALVDFEFVFDVGDIGGRACREVIQDVTWSPRAIRASARCEPIKPAPPVINTRIGGSLRAGGAFFAGLQARR